MKQRKVEIKRETTETNIMIELNLDGKGEYNIEIGLPFLNHMLELLSKHSLIDLKIKASGDIHIDYHHLVEDLGLTLGLACNKALGNRVGIRRYGWCYLPMDETLARAAVDFGGRPFLVYSKACQKQNILLFDLRLIEEFFRAFAIEAKMNLHVAQIYGDEPHHAIESMFKAVAKALRMAVEFDSRAIDMLPSTKGKI